MSDNELLDAIQALVYPESMKCKPDISLEALGKEAEHIIETPEDILLKEFTKDLKYR